MMIYPCYFIYDLLDKKDIKPIGLVSFTKSGQWVGLGRYRLSCSIDIFKLGYCDFSTSTRPRTNQNAVSS